MDLSFTDAELAFAAEIRAWLGEHLDLPPAFASLDDEIAWGRAWQAKLAADRWVGIHWPAEYGGRSATPVEVALYNMEYARSRALQPVNRVGINLAVQDAVAAANILAAPLKAGRVSHDLLEAVQRRREMPMRFIQWVQVQIQNRLLRPVLASSERPKAPAAAKLLNLFPVLQRIPARIVGMGIRPEHIHTPEA